MILDLFQQFFDLIEAQLINIPVDNPLGGIYSFLNLFVLFIVQVLTGGGFALPNLL